MSDHDDKSTDFEREASESQQGIVREFLDFLLHNKKWWLTPIILVLGRKIEVISHSKKAAAPFIYTLF